MSERPLPPAATGVELWLQAVVLELRDINQTLVRLVSAAEEAPPGGVSELEELRGLAIRVPARAKAARKKE